MVQACVEGQEHKQRQQYTQQGNQRGAINLSSTFYMRIGSSFNHASHASRGSRTRGASAMLGLGCTRHTEAALALLLSSAGHARAWVQRQRCCKQPRESHSRHHPGTRSGLGSTGLSEDAAPAICRAGRQSIAVQPAIHVGRTAHEPCTHASTLNATQAQAHQEALKVGHKALRQLA